MISAISWRNERVKKGLRKEELAKLAGVSARTISRLEGGDASVTDVTKSKIRNALRNGKSA
jgi:transcriptional regulator with XRE-family HTH domain